MILWLDAHFKTVFKITLDAMVALDSLAFGLSALNDTHILHASAAPGKHRLNTGSAMP